MKKKWLLVIGVILTGLIVGTTAFALTSGNDGYQTYKTALKNTWVVPNLTATAGVSVTDDGYPLLNSRDMMKMDLGSKDMSGYFIISARGQDCVAELYQQDSRMVTRIGGGDLSSVPGNKADRYEAGYQTFKANAREVERIIDLMTLNLQKSMTINDNPDGTRDVSLQVTGAQIPDLENAIVSLLLKSANNSPATGPVSSLISGSLPRLVENITVNGIDFQAKINADDLISQQTVNIAVSGEDADGNRHNLMLGLDLNLSGFGSTVPDTVK
ncbi:MAG: hypothetical protein HPY50_18910 [Firmicutes bacterium]|nr:hypothetical protein [Bacillota bacterium]